LLLCEGGERGAGAECRAEPEQLGAREGGEL